MIVSIIIVLIVALIVIALWVSAVQQHKEKQEAERRKELTKQKSIIEETEEALLNGSDIPLSDAIQRALLQRVHDALKVMVSLSTGSSGIKNRLTEAKERLKNPVSGNNSESFTLPNNDKQLISLIQNIKKLRAILRSEHNKGKINSQIFIAEDKRLEKLQLKINIESQIKRGLSAQSAGMVGSARQYLEKASATLSSLTYTDEYISTKKAEVAGYLESITNELKTSNASAVKKKTEQDQNDLDVLFAPKKKW